MSHPVALPPAESAALIMLSRALLSAARMRALYPGEHPVVRAAANRLRQSAEAASRVGVGSSVSVTPTTLVIRGVAGPDDTAVRELAAMLHDRGVQEIGFEPVVPDEAISQVLSFLAAATTDGQDVIETWEARGHHAVRIKAVDYAKVVGDGPFARSNRDPKDDVWRSIVERLSCGGQGLSEREQRRLLELADDPEELTALAETLVAAQCTPDGSPLVTTQATTVLACFRQLASIASVLAPDRVHDTLRNLASALLRLDPRVSLHVLSLEGGSEGGDPRALATALGEEGLAQLLAAIAEVDGPRAPRFVQMFELLVPDPPMRRRVLERARPLAEARHEQRNGFETFWRSIEELLFVNNDEPFLSQSYRAVLDAAACSADERRGPLPVAEMREFARSVGDDSIRSLSIGLLADLLGLERKPERAVVVLNHLADFIDDLLLGGAFEEARQALDAIGQARHRDDLATPAAQALQRIGEKEGVREAARLAADLSDAEWRDASACFRAIGPACLSSFQQPLLAPDETAAARRAGDLAVAMSEDAIPALGRLLEQASGSARVRLAALFGRIGSASAVPRLRPLLGAPDVATVGAAVRALAAIGDPTANRAVHFALRDCHGQKRQMVVDALVEAGDRTVVPLLARILDDCRPLGADCGLALQILGALARLNDGRAVAAITRVMFLSSWLRRGRLRIVRAAAVRALTDIGQLSAAQALDHGARTGDRMLRAMIGARARAAAGAA